MITGVRTSSSIDKKREMRVNPDRTAPAASRKTLRVSSRRRTQLLIHQPLAEFIECDGLIAVEVEEVKQLSIVGRGLSGSHGAAEAWTTDDCVVFMNLREQPSHRLQRSLGTATLTSCKYRLSSSRE